MAGVDALGACGPCGCALAPAKGFAIAQARGVSEAGANVCNIACSAACKSLMSKLAVALQPSPGRFASILCCSCEQPPFLNFVNSYFQCVSVAFGNVCHSLSWYSLHLQFSFGRLLSIVSLTASQ